MAEALSAAGGNQEHGAGAEVKLRRSVGAPQEVLCPQLLHPFQPAAGQLYQGPLGEVR